MIGSLDYAKRKLVVATCRAKRGADFIADLRVLDRLYAPKPGAPTPPVVLVLDNGPIHVGKARLAGLGERVHWLTIERLPKYAPEINDIEVVGAISKPAAPLARPSPIQTFSTRPSTTSSAP
jgi:hypothetical protein